MQVNHFPLSFLSARPVKMILPRYGWYISVGLMCMVYITGFGIDTMDVDASQYAEISMNMLLRGEYMEIIDVDRQYLDKPPLLFWLSSFSMKLFGINNVGYKLPSMLSFLFGLFALFRFVRLWYDEDRARIAVLVMGCSQAGFLMMHDIRTDTMLTAWVTGAIWMLTEFHRKQTWKWLLGAFCMIGLGMMSKGPIALMIPIFAYAPHLILTRDWKNLLRWQYFPGLLFTMLLLIPMCVSLYTQYDLHPEKVIDGQTGTSGLKFFFWTQSFGRITGENAWKNDVYFTFLLENMFWSFLPWMGYLLPGLAMAGIRLIKNRMKVPEGTELISSSGFVITYCALAMSKFQLPHYVFVILPLASVLVADFYYQLEQGKAGLGLKRWLSNLHLSVSVILVLGGIAMVVYVFPQNLKFWWFWCAFVLVLGGYTFVWFLRRVAPFPFTALIAGMLGLNLLMNTCFYPYLLEYQPGAVVGRYLRETGLVERQCFVYAYPDDLHSLHFYAGKLVHGAPDVPEKGHVLLTQTEGFQQLQKSGYGVQVIKSGPVFKVTGMKPAFLNPATRLRTLKTYYLVEITRLPGE